MFTCLYAPPEPPAHAAVSQAGPSSGPADRQADLLAIARAFVPRFEMPRTDLLLLDVSGLDRLVGPPRVIGEELRRAAADRGLRVHVAVAATRTAAWLLAHGRAGLTCVEPGREAAALAPLPLAVLQTLVRPPVRRPGRRSGRPSADTVTEFPLAVLHRWGLTTLGDLAALPVASLSERLGQAGAAWQRLARGEDLPQPLVPWTDDTRFEAALELDWPVEGLEPLSFVLGRLLEPLAADLERHDRAAAELHLRLGLVTKAPFERSLRLPAPIRDPRVLRTLVRLDLESHPPDAAIETVVIRIDPAPGRIVQESLLEQALPAPEQLSTLMARLTALVGGDRCGSPALVDSHRPGACAMVPFAVDRPAEPRLSHPGLRPVGSEPGFGHARRSAAGAEAAESRAPSPAPRVSSPDVLSGALRRFRRPLPARVQVEHGCPVQVTIDRRGVGGGRVVRCAGPWRTSGAWWEETDPVTKNEERRTENTERREPAACATVGNRRSFRRATPEREARRRGFGAEPREENRAQPGAAHSAAATRVERAGSRAEWREPGFGAEPHLSWNRDEWEVALPDGLVCRIFRDRETDRWFVDGVID